MNNISYNNIINCLNDFKNLPLTYTVHEPFNRERALYVHDNIERVSAECEYNIESTFNLNENLIKLLRRASNNVIYHKSIRYCPRDCPSFININKEARTYICGPDNIDIDAVACHSTIFEWIGVNLKCDLKDFRMAKKWLSKVDLYSFLNGGDTKGFEIACDSVLNVIKRCLELFGEHIDVDKSVENYYGKCISHLLCKIESVIMDIAINVTRKNNFIIQGLFYDGFYVKRTNESDDAYRELLDEIEKEVYDKYKIPMKFIVKEHDNVIKEIVLKKTLYSRPVIKENEKWVEAEDLNHPSRIVLIHAFLGMGKSTAVQKYIADYGYEYEVIIVICPRKTYSKNVMKLFNQGKYQFIHYQETTSRNIAYPYIVIQFESLHRMDTKMLNGKKILTIMDESEASLVQVTSLKTNHNHTDSIRTFELLMEQSKKIICLDAFIMYSMKTINLFRALGYSYKLFHYTMNKTQRDIVECPSVKTFEETLIHLLGQGKKIFLFSTSKYRIESIMKQKERQLKNYKFAVYMGGDENHTTQLNNVEEEWIKYQLVMCNSTITVGIDFNVEHFDYIMVYASQRSKNVCRDIFQALYRPRKLNTGVIYCIDCNDDKNLSHSAYRATDDFAEKNVGGRIQKYNTIIRKNHLPCDFVKDRLWLKKLFIQNHIEHLQSIYNLEETMMNLFKFCNYREIVNEEGKVDMTKPSINKELEDLLLFFLKIEHQLYMEDLLGITEMKQIEAEEIAFLEAMYNDIKDDIPGLREAEIKAEFDDIKTITRDEYKVICRSRQKSDDEFAQLLKYRYLKAVDCEEPSLYFEFYKEHRDLFHRIRNESNFNTNMIRVIGRITSQLQEVRSNEVRIRMENGYLFKMLGLECSWGKLNFDENRYPIEIKDMDKVLAMYNTKKRYLDYCDLMDIVPNKNHCIKTVKEAMTMLNRMLKEYSFTKIKSERTRVREGKKQVWVHKFYLVLNDDLPQINPNIFNHE